MPARRPASFFRMVWPDDRAAYDALLSKHPGREQDIPDAARVEDEFVELTEDDLDAAAVRKAVFGFHKGTACGSMQLRATHLQEMLTHDLSGCLLSASPMGPFYGQWTGLTVGSAPLRWCPANCLGEAGSGCPAYRSRRAAAEACFEMSL